MVRDNNVVPSNTYWELNLALVASRSSLVGALLRAADRSNKHLMLNFLRGLSRDELECLAEFEGAHALETIESPGISRYRLLAEFFDPSTSDRWSNSEDRAHKTFVLLAWTEHVHRTATVSVDIQ